MIAAAAQRLKRTPSDFLLVIPAQAGTQWRYSQVVAKEVDCARKASN